MINSFDTDVALDVGMVAAVLYKNIQYWCEKNKANDMNEHDGLYWTYNSMKAYQELFPYLGAKAIRSGLEKLEEKGYIKVGNFNEDGRDRTRWYADLHLSSNIEETEKEKSNLPKGQMQDAQKATSNEPKGQMRDAKRANASSEKGKPLPNNYTNNYSNNYKKESKDAGACDAPALESFEEILDSVEWIRDNKELRKAFLSFIALRQRLGKPLINVGLKLLINDVFVKGKQNPAIMLEILNNSIKNSYTDVYPPKEEPQNKSSGKYKSNVRRTGGEAGITVEPLPVDPEKAIKPTAEDAESLEEYEAEMRRTLDELKGFEI